MEGVDEEVGRRIFGVDPGAGVAHCGCRRIVRGDRGPGRVSRGRFVWDVGSAERERGISR